MLWPVVGFWAGASLLFLGGGLAALFTFAEVLLRNWGNWHTLNIVQLAWLGVGVFFVIYSLIGGVLAWQLARRRRFGYYGSLLLGLQLTMLAPGAALLLTQPNYLAAIWAGLIPAATVLLTLTNLACFDHPQCPSESR